MAARCTTPAAAMHHFGGMGAPFQRWPCTIICGQAALLERRTQAAVERNNTEGKQYITGDMNVQRNWAYYNSDYYYASESAISAITEGAQNVSQEYGSTFEVPDYMAQGKTNLYNFNTALSGDPFVASDYHYIVDPDVAPPENFKWF